MNHKNSELDMKKHILYRGIVFILSVFFYSNIFGQKTPVPVGTPVTMTMGPSTASCVETPGCDEVGFSSEYFIIDLETTLSNGGHLIVGASPDATIDGSDILDGSDFTFDVGACFAVTPVCYELLAIQQLVDGMIDPPFPFPALFNCCTQINNATPPDVSPDICDAVVNLFNADESLESGWDLQTLKTVLKIFSAFGNDSLSVSTFINTANGVNEEAGGLGFICASPALPFGYCVNPTDSLAFVITAIVALESIYFEGKPTSEGNFLEWNLAFSEKMAITLEKSENGVHYFPISTYPDIKSDENYSFTDDNLQTETSFYRLALEHADGTKEYSKIISLVNKSMSRVSLFSNLVSNELHLNFLNQDFNSVEIGIYNVEGRNLVSQISNSNNIDVSMLSPGLYFLRVRNGKAIQTLKFLKI